MKKKSNDILFGFHSILEAIKANKTIDKVLIKKGLIGDQFQECFHVIRQSNIPFQYVPVEKLNRMTGANHQGIVAQVSAIEYQDYADILPMIYESGRDPFFLILDGITDVRNFGAMARSAESAGVDAIIIGTKNSATVNADAINTSAGALNRLPVCRVTSIQDTIKYLHNSGIKVFGASEKASSNYFSEDLSGPMAIIMGAEDIGLSINSLKHVDTLIKIPMLGSISSLNVSVATGIILYEVVRQRNT
jgi:23S rRNA (guanosine2251-2'-O)-methyltransferase